MFGDAGESRATRVRDQVKAQLAVRFGQPHSGERGEREAPIDRVVVARERVRAGTDLTVHEQPVLRAQEIAQGSGEKERVEGSEHVAQEEDQPGRISGRTSKGLPVRGIADIGLESPNREAFGGDRSAGGLEQAEADVDRPIGGGVAALAQGAEQEQVFFRVARTEAPYLQRSGREALGVPGEALDQLVGAREVAIGPLTTEIQPGTHREGGAVKELFR